VVKDRPGTKVGLGHPERSLDLPQVVIGADTGEGWLYLATVIDLATRMVVGWQLADHIRTSLVVDASGMGIDAGLVAPNAIFTPIAAVRVESSGRCNTSLGRCVHGTTTGMGCDSDGPAADAVARMAGGQPTWDQAGVLDPHRRGVLERGRGGGLRRVAAGWDAVVS
jgi:hypothetical protein